MRTLRGICRLLSPFLSFSFGDKSRKVRSEESNNAVHLGRALPFRLTSTLFEFKGARYRETSLAPRPCPESLESRHVKSRGSHVSLIESRGNARVHTWGDFDRILNYRPKSNYSRIPSAHPLPAAGITARPAAQFHARSLIELPVYPGYLPREGCMRLQPFVSSNGAAPSGLFANADRDIL